MVLRWEMDPRVLLIASRLPPHIVLQPLVPRGELLLTQPKQTAFLLCHEAPESSYTTQISATDCGVGPQCTWNDLTTEGQGRKCGKMGGKGKTAIMTTESVSFFLPWTQNTLSQVSCNLCEGEAAMLSSDSFCSLLRPECPRQNWHSSHCEHQGETEKRNTFLMFQGMTLPCIQYIS